MRKFQSIKKYLSFMYNSEGNGYDFIEIEEDISQKFIDLVEKLEELPQVKLCTRGDSRKTLDEHNEFFNELLSKVFIVGTKSQSNMVEINTDKYSNANNNSKGILIEELNILIGEVNKEIINKPDNHNISGTIHDEFIKELIKLDVEALNKWKIFFLSFLHNSGSLEEFKSISPFLSMTYGRNKYKTAREFSIGRAKNGKGIVYLYALNSGDPYYIQTNLMTEKLKKFDIGWYEDIHNEIMLMNGMYPHYMLGIFEVTVKDVPRFIINPWLYDILKKDEVFDYYNGLKINQENFGELAKSLGYSSFFFGNTNGEAFISDLDNENIKKVIRA